MSDSTTLARAQALDKQDPLGKYRQYFVPGEEGTVYLDGNSLGKLPAETVHTMKNAVREQWGERLIRGWNEGWYQQPARVGKKISQLIGAHPEEVIVADSTSVNLYKLAYGALKLKEKRTEIISDDMNFPSDLYVLQGLVRQFGNRHTLRLLKTADGVSSDLTELLRMIGRQTALVCLSHVTFRSSYMYDMAKVTELAHMRGAMVLWDLSHSVGVVPVALKEANIDLAVGCTYKFLNGGPGSPAFLYVRKELLEKLDNPIQGWFGERGPFEFKLNYRTPEGIRKFMTGTPPILSLSGLEPALDLVLDAGIQAIRTKSVAQSEYLIGLAEEWLLKSGFRLGSPPNAERRGSHVSLRHAEAYRICRALGDPAVGDQVVIPDFREPNNIRLGISPLYTTYQEIWKAMDQLRHILDKKIYERYPRSREVVT
jgi:kynureninase